MLLPKQKPIRDKKYLKYIRTLPCVLRHTIGNEHLSVVPAHIRSGGGGTGLKPGDNSVLPLSADLHQLQHQIGEVRFWRENMDDELMMRALLALAEKYYRERNKERQK